MRNLIYKGRIREGGVGTLTPEEYCVFYDEDLEYAYLEPKPEINYEDSSYRIAVNASNDILRYYELHTEIQTAYFELVRKYIKKDSIVLEIGCGGGILLDKAKEKCFKTIGIEPNAEFQKSLMQNGHIVYSNIDDCLSDWQDKIDFIISFHVIEHVHHPEQFIQSVGQLLKPRGTSFILTPNYSDILLKINFNVFAPFFFRKVHPVYLTIESMKKMILQQGMEFIAPVYFHEFGLSNTLYWLRDKSPQGNLVMEGLDNSLDLHWKEYLIKTGQTKDIAVIFQKK